VCGYCNPFADIATHLLSSRELPPPQTMGQAFDQLAQSGIIPPDLAVRLKKAVGFRNVAVHDYEEIDLRIVHAIARNHVDDFEQFARAVMACLGTGENQDSDN